MKITKSVIVTLVLLVLVAALYRVFPNRPMGFAPQYAMAIFGGAIFVRNKKWAFVLPVLSMFLSDLLYQFLYNKGLSVTPGFYGGQWQNYVLFTLLTVIGFFIKKINIPNVLAASIASPTVYFLLIITLLVTIISPLLFHSLHQSINYFRRLQQLQVYRKDC